MELNKAVKHSIRNKELVSQVSICSCYNCVRTFSPSEIMDWTDQGRTAICPLCGLDAVLPGQVDNLQQIHDYWLKSK